jgi:hypothetical protein
MRLILNEQEVVDGICVFVAREFDGDHPEAVNVKEINYHRNGQFSSSVSYFEFNNELDTDQIADGIRQFLAEYHSFDLEVMTVELKFTEGKGVWAEVSVNE